MRVRSRRKYNHETAVAVNVTLPPLLHQKMVELVRDRGFSGPSDYFQSRIRLDAGLGLKVHEQASS